MIVFSLLLTLVEGVLGCWGCFVWQVLCINKKIVGILSVVDSPAHTGRLGRNRAPKIYYYFVWSGFGFIGALMAWLPGRFLVTVHSGCLFRHLGRLSRVDSPGLVGLAEVEPIQLPRVYYNYMIISSFIIAVIVHGFHYSVPGLVMG